MSLTTNKVAEQLNISHTKAAAIIGLVEGRATPYGFRTAEAWIEESWMLPSRRELIMCAILDVLKARGWLRFRGPYSGGYETLAVDRGDDACQTLVFECQIESEEFTVSIGESLAKLRRRLTLGQGPAPKNPTRENGPFPKI